MLDLVHISLAIVSQVVPGALMSLEGGEGSLRVNECYAEWGDSKGQQTGSDT